jgi:GNAT superfamily N-acetyltransferase
MHIDTNTVRTLGRRFRPALLRHFIALGTEDRRLRFGHPIGDEGIAAYVAGLDPPRDGLFVARDARRRVVGVAHIALANNRAEVGLSVLPEARGLGLGTQLFNSAAEFARGSGVARIDMHFLTENQCIQHIARKAGMLIVSHSGEADAHVLIPENAVPASEALAIPAADAAATVAAA